MGKVNIPKLDSASVKNFGKKHGTTIMLICAGATSVAAVITAVTATPKALELIERKKEELDTDKLEPVEIVKTTWKCYIPTALSESASIMLLICAATNSSKQAKMLSAAYTLSETAFREYREKIIETIGEKKEKAVRDEIAKDKVRENPPAVTEVTIVSSGDQLCFDPLMSRYFQSSAEKIRRAVNKVNDEMLRGYDSSATLNDLYYELGLAETKLGEELGWENMKTGLIEVQFSTQLASDEIPCLVMDFGHNPPTYFDLH